jgi:hypothetical protein
MHVEPNISSLPVEVRALLNANPVIFTDFMTQGMPWIQEHFTIIESDGQTPMWSIEALDFLRPAGDDWLPQDAVKLGAKVPKFADIDGDLSIPRSQIINMARSHVKNVAKAPSLKEALKMGTFAYGFIGLLTTKAGSLIEQNALFRGVRSNTTGALGSGLSMDGLNLKIATGVALGDIPAGNVRVTGGAIADADVYAEVNELAQKTAGNVAYDGKPMNLYLSPTMYRKYVQARRAANPSEQLLALPDPTTVDDFPNITFVKTPGLNGSQKMFISIKGNLFFCLPEGFWQPKITMIEDIKAWKTNLLFSGCVEYNYGKLVFTNDRP